ncbi:unnamed protein product [Miscanthus lutarioriparius]|uniref:Protein kinase domain-containing protein n=1 Tax=Miscanthus lutarioriparius TaxID=422564 RepID=A0A811QDF2_9POAL|nr:unnamed protein product [Miscanthus lutarioriparius]
MGLFLYSWGMKGDSSRQSSLNDNSQISSAFPREPKLEFLKNITKDFSSEREVGHGAFGVVYKGILQSGQLVAVKKLVRTSGVHDRRFQNEAGNLQTLEHRNIVKLLGSCYQVEKKLVERNGRHFLSDVPEKFLCYEYLSNGSLDKYIYEISHEASIHKFMEKKLQLITEFPREPKLHFVEEITGTLPMKLKLVKVLLGVVYKGMLQNGEVIAVKKLLVVPQINLDKQFKNEVFSLIDLNHRNIVKLIGYCYEIHKKLVESHGRYVFADTQERILCYEYLPRGSLDKYLYGILLYLILSLILVELAEVLNRTLNGVIDAL